MSGQTSSLGQNTSGQRFALVALTSLFFMWGFITSLNDILIPHLKSVFSLNYTQAMLIQFCFFGAYFLVSVPAGNLVKKVGFQRGLGIGLMIAAAGCLLFIGAAKVQVYWVFLTALFVLASGITILQVAANPLVTIMGPEETASSRLTMTQAFNSLGTTVAPIIGSILIFSATAEFATKAQEAESVIVPYFGLAIALIALALIFTRISLPTPNLEEETQVGTEQSSLMEFRHLVLGAVAIFMYVGAEVSIGSFLVNYFGLENIAGMPESEAAHYIAYYWGGAMVGRFAGAILMQKIAAGKLLAFNSVASAALIALSIASEGSVAMYSILLVGLCNSIMFPTIFSLALKGLGVNTSRGSGLLCLAIVGGAIVPVMQGGLADSIGLQVSFVLPLVCYLYIAYYGLIGSKVRTQ
ncbi:MAG: glucose/galactose MFS transporter [Marinomonas sp.]|uniref:FHS family L-fucose permease-like MFS transporter n=1 Tax=Marinomonas communis TaxID=28254 RepID=A0A4R6X3J4_9GAMM|nr:sugar MFS transporter [Marinomonas communis]MAF14573.1 glucose/galactose MFS transporter [Marinomonas sp.]MCC4275482.1 sugar MFS transporter [Marinomonas communis]TDR05862.1 FHS family L-fucose permease-like MFS transporter [Marinomonas communis]